MAGAVKRQRLVLGRGSCVDFNPGDGGGASGIPERTTGSSSRGTLFHVPIRTIPWSLQPEDILVQRQGRFLFRVRRREELRRASEIQTCLSNFFTPALSIQIRTFSGQVQRAASDASS
jgi:hypothetical protein